MVYENMPLYPGMRPPCDPSPCMKVRLFDDCRGDRRAPPFQACERVVIDNPCRRGERAEVVLGVDDCGNLVICVHRLRSDPCRPEPWRPEPCRPEPRPCDPWPDRSGPACPRRRRRPEWRCN